MHNLLSAELAKKGWQYRIIPISRLNDLVEEIEQQHEEGIFDEQFFSEWLSKFDTLPLQEFPEARSIILIALPQPQTRAVFVWNGSEHPFVIPPTYFENITRKEVEAFVAEQIGPAGYRVAPARPPKKLLAVRSGLAEYGRNNITYVPGIGSFMGLIALYSDLPAASGLWRENKMLDRCQSCDACRQRCPTGAIPSDRFVLRAELCLTFHNEHPAGDPFPSWVDPSWHNCLIGCLECQRICPINKDVLDLWGETIRFTAAETAILMDYTPEQVLPAALEQKLKQVDLMELLEVLPRNLQVLIRH